MLDFAVFPKVAIDFMNDDHHHFADLLNLLEEQLVDGEPEMITATLMQMMLHCREHFGREEQQMLHFIFPPCPVHKSEHERVLAGLEQVITQWQATPDRDLLRQVIAGISEWFVTHAATMDTVTASYIVSMGGPAEF